MCPGGSKLFSYRKEIFTKFISEIIQLRNNFMWDIKVNTVKKKKMIIKKINKT